MMYFDHQKAWFAPVRSVMSSITSPLQYVIAGPIHFVEWLSSGFSQQDTLIRQNAALRARLLLMEAKVQNTANLQDENTQLRALLKSSNNVGGRVIAAQLLAVDPSPFSHQILLNRGSDKAIYVGQPVIDAKGVMGQVIQVNKWSSRVLLITSAKSAIPVTDTRNGLRAIAEGTNDLFYLSLANVPRTMDIKVGDDFVTSGLGLRYPVGYPVGVVTSVKHEEGHPFATIDLRVTAGLNYSRQVLLVWPAESGEKLDEAKAQVAEMMKLAKTEQPKM